MAVSNVALRFVGRDDDSYAAAVALRHRLFYELSEVTLRDVPDSLEDSSLHLVAEEGGMVLGYGRLTPGGDQAQISQMVVDERWQGRGIGTSILAALISAARNHGVSRLHLSAKLDAVPFYARLGFVEVGEQSASKRLGIPVVRMELSLQGPDHRGAREQSAGSAVIGSSTLGSTSHRQGVEEEAPRQTPGPASPNMRIERTRAARSSSAERWDDRSFGVTEPQRHTRSPTGWYP